jgi:sulfoxide reductase catalytic subunit YedY
MVTPEAALLGRRRFLTMVAAGSMGALLGPDLAAPGPGFEELVAAAAPAGRDRLVLTLDRPLTPHDGAGRFSHYLELTPNRDAARLDVARPPSDGSVVVDGLVERESTFEVSRLRRIVSEEERVYRHRCVEGWAAAVPWRGIPLAALIAAARPLRSARYVRFVGAAADTAQVPRPDARSPWPYCEALTLAEATNELAFLATGMYGRDLPVHHGAPLRLVVPWKYAFKSIKAVTRIELVATRPATFWNTAAPHEYPFDANVDPRVPHPRWRQATEKMVGSGEVRATLPFNGYGQWVAQLYA